MLATTLGHPHSIQRSLDVSHHSTHLFHTRIHTKCCAEYHARQCIAQLHHSTEQCRPRQGVGLELFPYTSAIRIFPRLREFSILGAILSWISGGVFATVMDATNVGISATVALTAVAMIAVTVTITVVTVAMAVDCRLSAS